MPALWAEEVLRPWTACDGLERFPSLPSTEAAALSATFRFYPSMDAAHYLRPLAEFMHSCPEHKDCILGLFYSVHQ